MVWVLVDLPYGKKAIGTKWVIKIRRGERRSCGKNKARLLLRDIGMKKGLRTMMSFSSCGDRIEAKFGVMIEALMKSRFQMSSIGELTFFLGLQVKQKEDGIFISQDKFQITPMSSILVLSMRIFRLVDYAGANLEGNHKGEYVAAASCCRQNHVYHSKSKHIAIRQHFIRGAYEKKLIQVLKIHTDDNVADLLTKAFDVSRFQFLVVSIGMINPSAGLMEGNLLCCEIV
ncbi:hypothetical protein Tco_1049469 [Tanacetum coccineum]